MVRSSFRLAACSALIAAFLSACAGTDFAPDAGWDDDPEENAWYRDFYEDWFGKQLAAANEKPLVDQADLYSFNSRFRLLVLPSFSPAIVLRSDQGKDGSATITYTRLNGAGGYDPGGIAVTWARELKAPELESLNSRISAANIYDAAQYHNPVADDGVITICADGTRYVFEYLSASGRAFATRHECDIDEYPELNDLLNEVLNLAATENIQD
ncbi:hypothetical protein [Erythrobacter sp. JK5]|uniref:hypothetical protein n=1 Tax=Erythrobacter sp. JK5 TaxID=2829500 RepID=UPI001BA91B80|nr:hypothetical protein [Erythrobacter sp. JK5]QUL38765.1 hypothetical protein KDC96_05165 [Erythrobacter sp. JK5]